MYEMEYVESKGGAPISAGQLMITVNVQMQYKIVP